MIGWYRSYLLVTDFFNSIAADSSVFEKQDVGNV